MRDIYDISVFATPPIDRPLSRQLVALKLWQSGNGFDPEILMARFNDANTFDWDDLRQLVRKTQAIGPAEIAAACLTGFAFLAELASTKRDSRTIPTSIIKHWGKTL